MSTTLVLASRQATYDFGTAGAGTSTTIVLVRGVDVSDVSDLAMQVRCHALTIPASSNTFEIQVRNCVIDDDDPTKDFVGEVVGRAVYVGGALGEGEVGAMQLVGLRPTGASLRLELVATKAVAGVMSGTFSVDLIRRTGDLVRRVDLEQTLVHGAATRGRDIVVTEGSVVRAADGSVPTPLSIEAFTATVSGQPGHPIGVTAGYGMGDGEGGVATVAGGSPGLSGGGGDVFVRGGAGGTTSGGGGDVNCVGGEGHEDAGGGVIVVAGSGVNTVGASLTARGGGGGSGGGKATLRGGATSGSVAGRAARVQGGTGGTSAAGGAARVTGGSGGTSSGTGGLVKVAGGVANGTSSSGGAITAVGGDGGVSASGSAALARAGRGGTSAGAGGVLYLEAGAARASGVAGGTANVLGGAGVGSSGAGGPVIVTAGDPGSGNVTQGSRVILRAHETDYAESSTSYGQGAPGTVDVTTHGDGSSRRRRHRTFNFTSNSTTTRHLQLDSLGNRQVLIIRAHVTDSGTASSFASAWTIDGLAYRNGAGTFSYVLNTTKTTPAGVAASNVTFQLTDSSGVVRFSVDPPSNTTARRVIGWVEWQVS